MPSLKTVLVPLRGDMGMQAHLRTLVEGDEVELRREPENEFDANAIACWFRGCKAGYITRRMNAELAAALDAGAAATATITDAALTQSGFIREVPRLRIEWEEDIADAASDIQ